MATTTDDPVFGQHMTFAEADGRLTVDLVLDPGGSIPNHLHPKTVEHWTLCEGEVTITVAGEDRQPAPGEVVMVEAGTPHAVRNDGTRPAILRAEVDPAGAMRRCLEDGAAFNRDGRLTPRGLPKSWSALRDAATFVVRYADTTVLLMPPPFPPRIVQRTLLPLLARR